MKDKNQSLGPLWSLLLVLVVETGSIFCSQLHTTDGDMTEGLSTAACRFCLRHLDTFGEHFCGTCSVTVCYLWVIIGISIQRGPRKEYLTVLPLKFGAETQSV